MVRRIAWLGIPVLALFAGATVAFAQANPKGGKQDRSEPAKQEAKHAVEKVTPVFFGNEKCPCGKASDHDRFVEVDGQKVYACSDACVEALKKGDTKASLARAYPTVLDAAAKGCPACGKAVTSPKEAVFQGRRVKLCSDACAAEFKKDPGLYLVKANWPDAKDAKNTTDPIDGKPVTSGVVAICRNHLIHFSSARSVAAFQKDPGPALAKLELD